MKAIVAMGSIICGFLISVSIVRAQAWVQTGANTNYSWGSILSSADGTKLAAAGSQPGASIYFSTNSGTTWAGDSNAPAAIDYMVGSADGSTLAVAYNNTVYTTTNSGATWLQSQGGFNTGIQGLAMSANGKTLISLSRGDGIYITTNWGMQWIRATNIITGWSSAVCSANGKKMAAFASHDGPSLYTSTNAGATWQMSSFSGQPGALVSATSDGGELISSVDAGLGKGFHVSTNWGFTWTINIQTPSLIQLVCSANGSLLMGLTPHVANSQTYFYVLTSTNSGVNWVTNNLPLAYWNSVACSADGNQLLAAVASSPGTNGIWIAQMTPSPQLNLAFAETNLNFSWIVPSTNMALEESPDLMNWAIVTNVPLLNYSNLQEQVTLPSGSGNGFFRLVSQ